MTDQQIDQLLSKHYEQIQPKPIVVVKSIAIGLVGGLISMALIVVVALSIPGGNPPSVSQRFDVESGQIVALNGVEK